MKETIQVLWTGGMDSTLIMVQYSQIKDIRILPIYLLNTNGRKTEGIELSTMNKIYTELKKDERTKAELLPIRIVADSIEEIPDVAKEFGFEFYKRIQYKETIPVFRKAKKTILDLQKNKAKGFGKWKSNITRLSEQYLPIMSYIRSENVIVEIGILHHSIFLYPDIHKVSEKNFGGIITRNILDKDGTDPDIYEVFYNVSFPLCRMEKIDVFNAYSEMGYEHIRDMVWHCYNPIDDKPCGCCNTCVSYIRDGIYDEFDRDGLIRYIKFCDKERETINQQYQAKIEKTIALQSQNDKTLIKYNDLAEAILANVKSIQENAERQTEFLQSELKDLHADNVKLNAELNKVNADNVKLSTELNKINIDNDKLSTDNAMLNVELSRMNADNVKLNTELGRLNGENTQLTQRINAANEQIELLSHEHDSLNKTVTRLKLKTENLENKLSSVSAQNKHLSTNFHDVSSDLQDANAQIQSLITQKEELILKTQDEDKVINELRSKLAEIENSRSWRITKPLRSIMWFFRRLFRKG